jgi:2-iminobutanoate/2-iminopropanoate deaminase
MRSPSLFVLLALVACARPTRPLLEFMPVTQAAPDPFSPAVRVGEFLYLSGTIGTNAAGKVVPGGIRAETRQALQNIKGLVERNGSSMDRVFKCTVFLADMSEWPAMNEVYVTFFPGPKPARSAFGANGLALNARVEIDCIALLS